MIEDNMRQWYLMAVLAYHRGEWTSVPNDDPDYSVALTKSLEAVIMGCLSRKVNVPNAAREVAIFFEMDLNQAPAEKKDAT